MRTHSIRWLAKRQKYNSVGNIRSNVQYSSPTIRDVSVCQVPFCDNKTVSSRWLTCYRALLQFEQPSGQLIASDRVGFEAVLLLYKTVQFFLSIQLGIHAFKRLTISIV